MSTGVIINFCSNEKCFLDSLIKECSHFANEIVISYGDILYNGDHEDLGFLEIYKSLYPHVKFVQYHVDLSKPHSEMRGVINRPTAYWHNLARDTAVKALSRDIEWVFVIDADEIPDGMRVKEWLNFTKLNSSCCYKIATYWYFKLPIFQAKTFEDSILLIHKKHLTENNLYGDFERDFTIVNSGAILQRMNMGLDGKPLWHHYSWSRSKDGIRKKVSSWAHANDIFKGVNVEDVINYIYKNDGVNDFVHGYDYNIVDNKFGIEL
jgi:hypothetical protein